MLSGVRIRLTLLYTSATLVCIALFGVGSYVLLTRYFQTTTDLALQHKMAHAFLIRHAALPPELAAADANWSTRLGAPGAPPTPVATPHEGSDEQVRESIISEEDFSGELAAIFLIPFDQRGQARPSTMALPFAPDEAAAQAALQHGYDWRTVVAPSGTWVRLLTYRVPDGDAPGAIQAGRTLADQGRVLQQLLEGLIGLAGIGTVLIGIASWWLAGSSLRPAQQAWAHQQTFVANASHELRTPLTLLQASAEVAHRTLPPNATESQELLDDVLDECAYMSSLLDDLLLLSRLDARRLPLDLQPIALAPLLYDLQRQVGRIALEHDITIQTAPTGLAVLADPLRLRQVLLIVLDNALRYTPADGQITIAAAAETHQVRIVIADTGSGIAPEHLAHVFERFYQADVAHAGAHSGSGLGLALAKSLIEAQRGTIALHSSVGVGTRVELTLPCAT